MLFRFLLFLLAGLLIIPRLLRLLAPRRPEPQSRPRRADPKQPERHDPLQDLTRQDITDVDYEEIPPEE